MQSPPCATCCFHSFSVTSSWLSISPPTITRPTITNFRMLGSAEHSLFEQPNFMSFVHAIRNASPYFLYLTCEFKPHYARYVLVHAYC